MSQALSRSKLQLQQLLLHANHQRNNNIARRALQSFATAKSSTLSWTPVLPVAVAVATVAFVVTNEEQKYPVLVGTTTTDCEYLFLPSLLSNRNNAAAPQLQHQTASRKRNYTMALIESFSPTSDQGHSVLQKANETEQDINSSSSHQSLVKVVTVDSKYQVNWEKPLGVGAFGGVFEGVQRNTGKKVAIKQIPKQCTEYVTFQREMDALARIAKAGGHPNINTLRETFVGEASSSSEGNQDDNYYLVLDLIVGNEMFDQLCEKGAYSEADAARMVRQVASALAFLHDLGIVHSDLKPENLMLTSKDTNNAVVQIVDFGCSTPYEKEEVIAEKNLDDKKKRRTSRSNSNRDTKLSHLPRKPVASTPAYCPPEVLRTDQPCPRVLPSFDMWSLGVILFVMLTGKHPFDLDNDTSGPELDRRIVQGEMPSLDEPEYQYLSDDAKTLIRGLMAMDPKERWTAEQVLKHPWVQGMTAQTRKIESSDFKLKTFRRHKSAVVRNVFQTMLIQSAISNGAHDTDTRTNVCLLEAAFRQLDQKNLGYISTKEMYGDTRWYGADAQLSFSEFSDVLSDTISNLYLPSGHVLYEEGQKGDVMFFLNSGSVEVSSTDGFIQERNAGEFFGEEIAKRQDNKTAPVYSTTAVCATPVHVFAISRECFEKYMQADENVALTLAETDRLRARERSRALLGLNKNMRERTYHKDNIIFQQGTKGSDLFIVKEGDVDIFRDGFKVRTLAKGEMTGEHAAFYEEKPYNVTAVCADDTCKIGVLKGRDMHALFKQTPALGASFHDIILRRDFKKAICAMTRSPFPETEEDLRNSFDAIAQRKENTDLTNNVLNLDDLRRIMLDFDSLYSEDDIRSLLKSMDLNNSGFISWEEFKVAYGMAKEA